MIDKMSEKRSQRLKPEKLQVKRAAGAMSAVLNCANLTAVLGHSGYLAK
ncbi:MULTISPECIES: hypothetical protein [Bacillus]|nr:MULTISPECIES: hypothetical protein [Bacillus]MCM2582184.1 hypothetical protein [Bacillus stercoris]